ncbi:hypothetical protein MKX03_005266 [Papaver bracteatum]|nr:hypothetical protein MKX03_005266 [Papaver bracteatum]
MNGYVYWAGVGIFHSGVEVHGVEYAFGAHDCPTSGVFKSIFIGTTTLDPIQVREFMERHSTSYNGDKYHLIVKNYNHFCKDVFYWMTGNQIPKWVNRLARIAYIKPLLLSYLYAILTFLLMPFSCSYTICKLQESAELLGPHLEIILQNLLFELSYNT